MNLTKINFQNNCKIKCGIGEDIIIEDGHMRTARSSNKLNCPKKFDNDLAYLAGYHLGDGYLEDANKTYNKFGKGHYEITYSDKDKNQLDIIKNIFINEFNYFPRMFKHHKHKKWLIKKSCKVLHWFMNKILELPMGKRNVIRIPNWILAKNEFLRNFLSGFFDAEADVSKTTNVIKKGKKYYRIRIQLTQKDKNILLEIRELLINYFGIKSDIQKKWSQNAYILRIGSTKMVRIFKDIINFRNPNKREKLDYLINN